MQQFIMTLTRLAGSFPLFVVLALLNIVPVWIGPAFPSIDGPAHVALVHIWSNLAAPQFAEFYEAGTWFAPNMASYALLAPLMKLLPPLVAEQVLVSIYLLALPFALRYALGVYNARALALYAIPLGWCYVLYFGFYSFLLGTSLFALSFGYWLRVREAKQWEKGLVVALLALICWWAHLSAALMFLGLAAATVAAELVAGKINFARALRAGLPFVPAAILIVWYALAHGGDGGESGGSMMPTFDYAWTRTEKLFEGGILVGLLNDSAVPAKWLVIAIAGLLVISALSNALERFRGDGAIAAFALLTLLFLSLPSQVQVRWVTERTGFYLLIFALIAAASRLGIKRREWLQLAALPAIGLALWNVKVRAEVHEVAAPYTARYLVGAPAIPRGATVLSLRLMGGVSSIDELFAHIQIQGAGRYTVLRDAVDVKLLQAKTKVVPVWFKPGKDAYTSWGKDEDFIRKIPVLDLDAYVKANGRPVDVIVMFGRLGASRSTPYWQALESEITSHGYRRVPCDAEGWLTLYFAPGVTAAASCQSAS